MSYEWNAECFSAIESKKQSNGLNCKFICTVRLKHLFIVYEKHYTSVAVVLLNVAFELFDAIKLCVYNERFVLSG